MKLNEIIATGIAVALGMLVATFLTVKVLKWSYDDEDDYEQEAV